MTRIAVLATILLASLTLAPTASAESNITGDLRGCAEAWLYGGDYYGKTMQCSGVGVLDRALVEDLQGCLQVLLYGGTYWGTYLACDGRGVLPPYTHPLVQDVIGCAQAIATGGTYWGTYLVCRGA